MATDKIRGIAIDTNPAQKSVKELRERLKQLRSTLLSVEQDTEKYNEALTEAANIQHTLKEQMEYINASAKDFGQMVSNGTKAIGGLVAGFQAANAVMNLFGIENEEVLKSLQKMQNLMALTQSFSAIDNGIKAFKRLGIAINGATLSMTALSKALLASGIGLAIAAVGYLAANWDKVKEALMGTNEELEKQKQLNVQETIKETNDELQRQINLRSTLIKIQGGSDVDVAVAAEEMKKQALEEATEAYNQQLKVVEDLQDEYDKTAWAVQNWGKKTRQKATLKEANNNLQLLEDNVKNLQKAYDDASKNTTDTTIIENAKKTQSNKDAAKEAQKLREKEWEEYNKQLAARYKAEEDLRNKLKALDKQYREEQQEMENEWAETLTPLQEQALNIVQTLRNAFKTPEEQYQAEQDALKTALNNKLIAQTEYDRLSEALAKEHNENMKVLAIQETQVWMGALQNLGNVFSSIASMMDRSTEEGQKQYKALMYTSTIISTLAGVGGAIASAFMPVNAGMTIWGQIAMAATTSASVLASGIAQLVQIKNASSTSTLGNAGGIGSTISNSAVNTIQAPLEFTQAVQGANIESAIGRRNAQKVYVTETDITNTQNKVKVSESEARF